MSDFVAGYRSPAGDFEMHHLDGVPWNEAPMPPWLHRCKVQTYGYTGYFTLIERCACGAIRMNGLGWHRKNERRKGKR